MGVVSVRGVLTSECVEYMHVCIYVRVECGGIGGGGGEGRRRGGDR